MSAADYLENKLLDHCLKVATFTVPTALFMSLHTAAPGETGTANELTGGSYARQTIAFAAAVTGQSANSSPVSFAGLPTSTVTHFAIFDAVSGGNPLLNGALAASQTITSGNTLSFGVGQVTVACD